MNSFTVTINNETAVLSWRDGKIYADGYDIENEKIALALNSNQGQGIGVLLVAIDELHESEVALGDLLNSFEKELLKLEKDEIGAIAVTLSDNNMIHQYLSFSPKEDVRACAVAMARFSRQGYKRIIKDGSEGVLLWLARMCINLPEDIFYALATHPREIVRITLAQNKYIPIQVIEILAKDKSREVRDQVRKNPIFKVAHKNKAPLEV